MLSYFYLCFSFNIENLNYFAVSYSLKNIVDKETLLWYIVSEETIFGAQYEKRFD